MTHSSYLLNSLRVAENLKGFIFFNSASFDHRDIASVRERAYASACSPYVIMKINKLNLYLNRKRRIKKITLIKLKKINKKKH